MPGGRNEGEVLVRPGSPGDLPAVDRIENRCFADPWSRTALAGELVADALRLPLVALVGPQVVGYIMAWRIAEQLHVLNLAVDPGFRRRGIACSLLREATRQARSAGQVEVTLEVRRSNQTALEFYRRLGFRQIGLRRGYYQDNGEDALILDCPVDRLLQD